MYFDFSNQWMILLLIILIVENIQNVLLKPGGLLALVLSLPGLLIAISFHEFAHAFVADKLGDDTPRRNGRLTLNPLAHMDPFGMVLLLFAGFGWGKPVEVNPRNYTRKISMRTGNAIVSFAGPAMNFILAIVFSIIYGVLLSSNLSFMESTTGFVVQTAIMFTISMNVGLGVFNLIPLPPLDGSKILLALLPTKARIWYEEHESMLYMVSLIVWLTPISTWIISPAISLINNWLISIILAIAG